MEGFSLERLRGYFEGDKIKEVLSCTQEDAILPKITIDKEGICVEWKIDPDNWISLSIDSPYQEDQVFAVIDGK